MIISFVKYHGTGNDFIVIDNRSKLIRTYSEKEELIAGLCHRKFGIGADGLMLLNNHTEFDFEMIYFNSDGKQGSMCGNGGRCIVAFAHSLGLTGYETKFLATDGVHEAKIISIEKSLAKVSLKMKDVPCVEKNKNTAILNTGSPHFVELIEQNQQIDVVALGRKIRYSNDFPEGVNVNFVSQIPEGIFVRTYERGVEDETLSCGTGVTACALAFHSMGFTNSKSINVKTKGGDLNVSFEFIGDLYSNIWLTGNAASVYKGEINI